MRRDGTPKPAFYALALVKGEWWLPPTEVVTDDAGRVTVEGCGGEYRVATSNGAASAELSVRPAESRAVTVTLA